jgi:hypothetical protein
MSMLSGLSNQARDRSRAILAAGLAWTSEFLHGHGACLLTVRLGRFASASKFAQAMRHLQLVKLNLSDIRQRNSAPEESMLDIVPAFGRIGEENAFAVLARATELQRQGKDIINLGIGQPDFPTPPQHRRGGDQGAARRPPRLHPRHRHPAAARGGRRRSAPPLRRERLARPIVMIVPGGKVTMFMAILMFGQPGARSSIPIPASRSIAR